MNGYGNILNKVFNSFEIVSGKFAYAINPNNNNQNDMNEKWESEWLKEWESEFFLFAFILLLDTRCV
jgi:hypothetical protein